MSTNQTQNSGDRLYVIAGRKLVYVSLYHRTYIVHMCIGAKKGPGLVAVNACGGYLT